LSLCSSTSLAFEELGSWFTSFFEILVFDCWWIIVGYPSGNFLVRSTHKLCMVVRIFEHTQTVGTRCWANDYSNIKDEMKDKVDSIIIMVLYMLEGIFIGSNLYVLHKTTKMPLTQMFTTLLNYKGKVVIFSFQAFILQLSVTSFLDIFI
jgi:hypothetical protein